MRPPGRQFGGRPRNRKPGQPPVPWRVHPRADDREDRRGGGRGQLRGPSRRGEAGQHPCALLSPRALRRPPAPQRVRAHGVQLVKVRAAGLLDVSRIEELHRNAQSHPNEAYVPAARLWSVLSLTLSAVLPRGQDPFLYVAEDGGKVQGFVQASGTPGVLDLNRAKVLQVLNLQVADGPESEDVAAALVEHLSHQALQRGAHRLFVRLPDRDPLLPVFRLRGFRQYATEQVLFAEEVRRGVTPAPAGPRPPKPSDAPPLLPP